MLEILVIIALSKRIAAIAKGKGRGPTGWVILFILLWIGGELTGAIVAGIGYVIASGEEEPNMVLGYLGALVGAATGALIAFAIVKNLAPVGGEDGYWQVPESEDYREKLNPDQNPTQPDAEKYRASDEKGPGRRSPDDPGYRALPEYE